MCTVRRPLVSDISPCWTVSCRFNINSDRCFIKLKPLKIINNFVAQPHIKNANILPHKILNFISFSFHLKNHTGLAEAKCRPHSYSSHVKAHVWPSATKGCSWHPGLYNFISTNLCVITYHYTEPKSQTAVYQHQQRPTANLK